MLGNFLCYLLISYFFEMLIHKHFQIVKWFDPDQDQHYVDQDQHYVGPS